MASLVAELKLVISGFRKSLADADKAQKQLGASASGVKVGDKLFSGVAPAAQGMSRNADAAFRQVQRSAERAFKGVNSSAGMMTGGINGMISQIGIGALRDVGARLVGFFANLGPQISNALARGMEQQQLELSFGALSDGKGKEVFEELRQQYLATGIAIDQNAKSMQRFMAMEMSPEEAVKLNKALLDIGGSIGATPAQIGLIGTALSQVVSKQVASMEELRGQIGEQGVPVFKALAESLNMDTPQLFEAIKDGKVSAEQVVAVFRDMTGPFEKFRGGAERLGSTTSGMLSRIGANFTELRRAIEVSLLAPLQPAFEFVLEKMTAARLQVESMAKTFQAIFASGEGMRIMTDLLQLGLKESVNVFYQGLMGAISAMANIMSTADFWAGLGKALQSATYGLAAIITDTWATMLDALANVAPVGADGMRGMANDLRGSSDNLIEASKSKGAEATAGLFSDQMKTFAEMAFKAGAAGAKVFDVAAERAKLFEEIRQKKEQFGKETSPLKEFEGGKSAPAAGAAGGDGLTAGAAGRRQVFGGSIRSTIDMILGRSEQAIMTVELKTQTTLLAKIAKNTEPKDTRTPPRPMSDPVFS